MVPALLGLIILLLIWLIVLGLLYWLGTVLSNARSPTVNTGKLVLVLSIVLLIVGVLFVIYFLIGFPPPLGHPLWPAAQR